MAPEPELATVVHSPRPDQDCGLLEALRGREPTAADCLVSAYGERSYRLAARITRNEQDAEEVVQDAFYAVIQKIDTFRASRPSARGSTGSWRTPPIKSSASAGGDATRCVGTKCYRRSMSTADTSRALPTGRRE